ncbi:2-hydroxychromene-2-carboxylate isomerase [Actinokineospora enzanensis]|uniref:2-hydroxychromene-2-carboxylate isomerase n=1 Tax=Actinokineospora enzanensis TaxID=155975 RepID=UPI0003660EBB|nr:DsbA family protein [Actinokineospora enzanensis]
MRALDEGRAGARVPRIHFSFRSPFSWLGLLRLRELVPDLDDRVRFVPFWDPDPQTDAALAEQDAGFHYVQMSKAKHLYILQDTRRQAARLGVTMRWPIDDDPWWEVPHLAWLAAQRLGRGREFYDEVCAARWERGEDVCVPEAVRAIAGRLGLPAAIADATGDPDIRAEATRCLVAAYHDDIFGIPYFRVGPHRYWGLDRVESFAEALLARADPPAEPRPPVPAGAYDTDTAGGCG